jgi:hypothetical protein
LRSPSETERPHAYVLYFGAVGLIDRHVAGFGQLFFALAGDGWATGEDDVRQSLREARAAFIARGEVHSKPGDTGLAALMFQVGNLDGLTT